MGLNLTIILSIEHICFLPARIGIEASEVLSGFNVFFGGLPIEKLDFMWNLWGTALAHECQL